MKNRKLKVSNAAAATIRKEYKKRGLTYFAKKHGVSVTYIWRITRGLVRAA